MRQLIRAALLTTSLVSQALLAHHAFVMFDLETEALVRGTVAEFQFRNPHTYLFVDVRQGDSQVTRWRIEGETRNDLFRNGWRDDSLQPGEVVTVRVQPNRDPARSYARLLSVEKADGAVLSIPNEEDERGRDNAVPADSLEGVWLPIQTFRQFQTKVQPFQTEDARAALARQSGLPPNARCIDLPIPGRLGRAHVYEIEFAADDLILIHSEDDAEPRSIHLDGRGHPQSIPEEEQSWTGHSIGRWEGDTLVIDTRHFKPHPGGNGAPPSSSGKPWLSDSGLTRTGPGS